MDLHKKIESRLVELQKRMESQHHLKDKEEVYELT